LTELHTVLYISYTQFTAVPL